MNTIEKRTKTKRKKKKTSGTPGVSAVVSLSACRYPSTVRSRDLPQAVGFELTGGRGTLYSLCCCYRYVGTVGYGRHRAASETVGSCGTVCVGIIRPSRNTECKTLWVHALIRHGARTPWSTPECWQGYDTRWNCNVTEIVSPSLSPYDGGVSENGLFRKVYDASPEDNILQGTCKEGQLLEEGFKQEVANGLSLREAYVCDGTLCLFANSSAADLQNSGALYLRSDDGQRTVMSGQILTAEMLNVSGVVLDWHTNDAALDYISPNKRACPRLTELYEEALNAPEWIEVMTSPSVEMLNESLVEVWGGEVVWGDVLDCLMTTACTGNDLPKGMTQDIFDSAVEHATRKNIQVSSYNDAAYGKLGMAKLTAEIREHMDGAINGTSPLKFVLISGHDTTFLAFLSAVAPGAWDEVFPPYASLSTIELLRVGGEEGVAGDYFRFVYNGQVLRLKGCDQDICAIDAFKNATQFALDFESDHCCCRNMTQTEVDAADDRDNDQRGISSNNLTSSVPSSAASLAPSTLATPAPGADASGIETRPSSSENSGLITSGVDKSTDSSGGTSVLGIAVACFVVGAVVGGVPAFMYFRSFRYETLRTGRHSYEMT